MDTPLLLAETYETAQCCVQLCSLSGQAENSRHDHFFQHDFTHFYHMHCLVHIQHKIVVILNFGEFRKKKKQKDCIELVFILDSCLIKLL